MKAFICPDEITYTGEQLVGHWAYNKFGVLGDSIVAFVGPCLVKSNAMVDLKDKRAGESIKSDRMVHFIVELFGRDMESSVLYQRILINALKETIKSLRTEKKPSIFRRGDDLYLVEGDRRRKLSVSIATIGPTSALIHAGVNVTGRGAPVAAAGLEDLSIDENIFVDMSVNRFCEELDAIDEARVKTRAVGEGD